MNGGIFDAYLADNARAFFEGHFANPHDRRRALHAARPMSQAVAEVLVAQNAAYAASPARDANLQALRAGAVAVVTGQQMGLFLGPLFTTYKAASTVRVARALAHDWGRPVVPIFWLQTEDHDLPEIAECHLPARSGASLRLSLPASPTDRVSVAHHRLPDEITACLAALAQELGNLPHAEAHLARLAKHYQPGVGWSTAFAQVLAGLFADEGLVLVDPRDPALAALAAPVHHRAVTEAATFATVLGQRAQALEHAGYPVAVHVRAGAPLSFFHPDGAHGPRYRLEPTAGGFVEVGGGPRVHTPATLLAALAANPLSFSASALLRPIIQDSLLPSVAYIGGPGEIAYFAQLAPLYGAFALPMPIVMPRSRLRLIETKTQRLLERLSVRPADAALADDAILARARAKETGAADAAGLGAALQGAFDAALTQHTPTLLAASPDMQAAIGKTRGTVEMAVGKLMEKFARALIHQDEGLVADVQRLKLLLYPNDMPQERFFGIAYFAARYGERAWLEKILEAATPFDATPQDVYL